MMRRLLFIAVLLTSTAAFASEDLRELDRSGSIFVSPKLGLSFPAGALADGNYSLISSSWRKEGISLTTEVGYYLTNSTIVGLEISYSTFNPKKLSVFALNGSQDKSRVRVRRFGIYYQYQVVPTGKYRPFMKLGLGVFDVSRISMPQAGTPLTYKDYSMGGKPVFSLGVGVTGYFKPNISAAFSFEAVTLNSFGGAWETTGEDRGPLYKNMLFFPVYLSLSYYLPN